MATGMEMLMKSMGIDPQKITSDFTNLKDGVLKTLADIDARMTRMETRLEEIWKANQLALSRSSQIQLVPQQPQPSLQHQPQSEPNTQPTAQPQPQPQPQHQLSV